MFIKVNVGKKFGTYKIFSAAEKVINTNAIATIESLTEEVKFSFEDKDVDVVKVELLSGNTLIIIGKMNFTEEGNLTITE